MATKDPVLEALKLYGTAAIPGAQSNPIVLDFFKQAGHPEISDDDTPWCSAFLNALMRGCGLPYTGSLAARSWLTVGTVETEPKLGDVVIFGVNPPNPAISHVGMFISKQGNNIWVLGGNQDNRVEIALFKTIHILGYRRLTIS